MRGVFDESKRRPTLPLNIVRENHIKINWGEYEFPIPPRLGKKVIVEAPLDEIVKMIDWTFFFTAWDIRGRFPSILEDEKYGSSATELYNNAKELLDEIVKNKLIEVRAVYGFWPSNSDGDDIILFNENDDEICRLNMLRQQQDRGGSSYACLADFVAQRNSGKDCVGLFAVTGGIGVMELVAKYEGNDDDYNAIMVRTLGDRLAEASAEWLHSKVRSEWGFPDDDDVSLESLLKEKYRGIRPAFGYPACPDHSELRKVFNLLDAESIGLDLTENCAITPAASVSGMYLAHPDSKYFAIGRVDREQIDDYAKRKGCSVKECEELLYSNLSYVPND